MAFPLVTLSIKNRPFLNNILISKENIVVEGANNAIDIYEIIHKMVPMTDKTIYTKEKVFELIQQQKGNIPVQYSKSQKFWTEKNQTCGKYPKLFDLNFNNHHWQFFKTVNGSYFYILSAFYDNRTLLNNKPVVRILSMISTLKPYIKPYCQFWFKELKQPIFIKLSSSNYIWVKGWGNYKEGILQPYLLTCDIPRTNIKMVPASVSLVESPCDNAKTNINVINNQPALGVKQNIAVCVKGLDLLRVDFSVRLVEWLELLYLLGVNKVIMYELEVHPNISKVLSYYQTKGFIDVIPLTLPGTQPNFKDIRHRYLKEKYVFRRQNEVIPYNDCFYRNMNNYKYISLLDTDEVIMPRKNITTWTKLLDIIQLNDNKHRSHSSFIFRNVYTMPSMTELQGYNQDIPTYMHMLRNVYRSVNYTKPGAYIKAFHNTERILTLHNHFPFACIGGQCSAYSVNTNDAHLMHYRDDCVAELKKVCNQFKKFTVRDENIWRYKEKLSNNTFNVLFRLGFFDYVIGTPNTKWLNSGFSHYFKNK
ncbi:unnamed protein product [Meganyctiphanes norvegica]|uniref:Glycosyltransferase family 92 protein n=1 Tax=Meganyctiphanes norvegica TaxID=48144 RepID=A0AAV2RA20_MEGNR